LTWSPDSRRLACGRDGTVYIWGSAEIQGMPTADNFPTGLPALPRTVSEEYRAEEAKLLAQAQAEDKIPAWQELAIFQQNHQLWEKAAQSWDRCVQLAPNAAAWHFEAALIQLMAGHEKTYREYRAKGVSLVNQYVKPVTSANHFARICSLLPASGEDYQSLLMQAQGAARNDPDKWWMVYSPGPILYRMDRYSEARDVFERAQRVAASRDNNGHAILCLWLALTYHQLHADDKAKKSLAEANQFIQAWMPKPVQVLPRYQVRDYIECHFLQKEATALIGGEKAPIKQPEPPPPAPELKKPATLAQELAHPDGPVALLDLAEVRLASTHRKAAEETIRQVEAQLNKLAALYPQDDPPSDLRSRLEDLRTQAAVMARQFDENDSTPLSARTAASLLNSSPLQAWEAMAAILSGGVVRWEHGSLSKDSDTDRLRKGCFACVYELELEAGPTYSIDLESSRFDAFLRLEDSAGKELLRDDDSGEGTNSRLIFRAPQSGSYRVIATSFGPNSTGDFVLTIRR
jgi:tetratricopeptide (TPR) repeat protein